MVRVIKRQIHLQRLETVNNHFAEQKVIEECKNIKLTSHPVETKQENCESKFNVSSRVLNEC